MPKNVLYLKKLKQTTFSGHQITKYPEFNFKQFGAPSHSHKIIPVGAISQNDLDRSF